MATQEWPAEDYAIGSFFQGQILYKDLYTIHEALVESYNKECQEQFSAKYWFTFSIYLLQAEK